MDKMYKAEEVAELLQCSVTFVYEHKLELGAVRIGTLIRFPESKLKESFNVNVEERTEMVLQVPVEGRVGLGRKGVQHPAGRKACRIGNAREIVEDEKDPFGLYQSLRKSITGAKIQEGPLLLVRQ